jgi:hypothetical protein
MCQTRPVARTLGIDDVAYAGLLELAEHDHVTLEEELVKVIETEIARREAARHEAARREQFFQEMEHAYASMTPEELAQDADEFALWDEISDGLENEPPYPLDGLGDEPKEGPVRS